jgi:hypothetical protein
MHGFLKVNIFIECTAAQNAIAFSHALASYKEWLLNEA